MEQRYKITPKQYEYLKKATDEFTRSRVTFAEKQEYLKNISDLIFEAVGVPDDLMLGAILDDETQEIVVNIQEKDMKQLEASNTDSKLPDKKPEETT